MLDETQRLELIAALVSAYPQLADFDLMLRTRVNQMRERLSATAAMPDVITAVVKAAESEFWIRNLIAGAVAHHGNNPALADFIARNQALTPGAAAAAPVNHYAATFFVGFRVFLNRPALRANIQQVGRGKSSRVCVVTGPRGTGKTYSRSFVGYLLQFDPDLPSTRNHLVYLDLDQYALDLEGLALRIGGALGLKPDTLPKRPPSAKEQDSRWLPDLFDWLRNHVLAGPPDVWWLILDGFRVQTLPPEALDLIDLLADFSDEQTTQLRLILLNYPRHGPFWSKEEIVTPVIKRADIEAFVQSVYQESGATADTARVTQAVDEILTQVQKKLAEPTSEPHQELQFLSLALTNTARQLLR